MNDNLKNIYDSNSPEQLEYYLGTACFLGQLNKVEYLIKEQKVDIHFNCDEPLREACRGGNLNIAQYLLSSPNLKNHAYINNFNENNITPLAEACVKGNLDLVKYLLTSPELINKADISLQDYKAFKLAFYRKHDDILNYLIFEHKVEQLPTIVDYMASVLPYDGDKNYSKIIDNMFLARLLSNEIPLNNKFDKKIKL